MPISEQKKHWSNYINIIYILRPSRNRPALSVWNAPVPNLGVGELGLEARSLLRGALYAVTFGYQAVMAVVYYGNT